MIETCMKPEIVDSVKTIAQIKYENKMNRYNANREKRVENVMRKLNKKNR